MQLLNAPLPDELKNPDPRLKPAIEAAWSGYRTALIGRYRAGGDKLTRALAEVRSVDATFAGPAQLLLGLTARARGDWAQAIAALQDAHVQLLGNPPLAGLAWALLTDAKVQAGQVDEARSGVEKQAAQLAPGFGDLASATVRLALGQLADAVRLAGSAASALQGTGGSWAQSVLCETEADLGHYPEAVKLASEKVAAHEAAGVFDELYVRWLCLHARARTEQLLANHARGQRPQAVEVEKARAAVTAALGYATNMPHWLAVAQSSDAVLRLATDDSGALTEGLAAAEALAGIGSNLEAGRLLARLAGAQAALQRGHAVPMVARARDLLTRSGAHDRSVALANTESSGPELALSMSMAAPAKAMAQSQLSTSMMMSKSIAGMFLEEDVELKAIFDVTEQVTSTRKVDELLQRIAQSAVKVLKAQRCAVLRRSADGKLTCVAAQGIAVPEVVEGKADGVSFSVIQECIKTGAPVLADNAVTDERFKQKASVMAADVRSVLCAPLKTPKGVLGVVYLDSTIKSRAFTQMSRDLLGVFCSQAAISLENATAFAEIEELTHGLEKKVEARTKELEKANGELHRSMDELKNTRLKLAETQRDALEAEMKLARGIQESIVPPRGVIDAAGVQISGWLEPASYCGGDFWSFVELPDRRVLVFVGDVTGHGMASALLTAVAKSCLDTFLARGGEVKPAPLLQAMSDAIFQSARGKLMMTGWVGIFDQGTLTYANAGHNLPFFIDAKSGLPTLKALVGNGVRLGDKAGNTYDEKTQAIGPGDKLILFTDGLVECTNSKGEEWGARRMRKSLAAQAAQPADKIVSELVKETQGFFGTHPRDDDITLVVAAAR